MSNINITERKRKAWKRSDDGWGGLHGFMDAKVQKLDNQFNTEGASTLPKLSKIFEGIAVHVNGYTNPNSAEIKRLMQCHGGQYIHYYSRPRVTHIIASNLPNSKITTLHDKKVVRPEWITSSIAAGKLLPYQDFLLYGAQNKCQPGAQLFRAALPDALTAENSSKFDTLATTLPHLDIDSFADAQSHLDETTYSKHGTLSNTQRPNKSSACTLSEIPGSFNIIGEPLHLERTSQIESDALSRLDETFNNSAGISSLTFNSNSSETTTLPKYSDNVDNKIQKKDLSCEQKDMNLKNTSSDNRQGILSFAKTSPFKSTSVGKAGEPQFLSEFYAHSRLHYLSTWKAELKAFMNQLVEKGASSFPGKERLQKVVLESMSPPSDTLNHKVIMHIDMDCFFVTVGLLSRPHLKGKPVAVTHGQNNSTQEAAGSSKKSLSMSEIASCSYEARKAGIKNGMLLGRARQLCPDLITIPYDFEGYKSVSEILYRTLSEFTLDIEAVSCDEVLVDCTEVLKDSGATPHQMAALIRQEIFAQTQCTASAGIGPSVLVARMATKVAKPNGQHYVPPDQVAEFMKDKSVADLPGVGWSQSKKLKNMNICTCEELQKISHTALEKEFGPKTGQSLYNYCRGRDERTLQINKERKSVSAEVNYGMRFTQDEEVLKFLKELSAEVSNRLKQVSRRGQQITLKLKVRRADQPMETAKFMGHGVCDNVARAVTFSSFTDDPNKIYSEVATLLKQIRVPPCDVRGMGIQISKLNATNIKQKVSGGILRFATKLSNSSTTAQSNDVSNKPTITHTNRTHAAATHICNDNEPLVSPSKLSGDAIEQLLLSPILKEAHCTHKTPGDPPLPSFPTDISCTPPILKPVLSTLRGGHLPTGSPSPVITPAGPHRYDKEHLSSTPVTGRRIRSRTRRRLQEDIESCTSAADHTFSNPDPEVLQSLPEDIQKEILLYKNRNPVTGHTVEEAASQVTNELHEVLVPTDSSQLSDSTVLVPGSKPRLCGVSSLEDIKKLLVEWLRVTEVPEPEDVERLRNYLEELVPQDLEQVDLLFKFLYRQIKKKNVHDWTCNLQHLINETQEVIKNVYGYPMKVTFDIQSLLYNG